ncbi:trichoplein keratin filament-binding protein-like isoform X2 [Mangifera indica]|uniref:trichoplein keratin filament-binding protein-like isoform X2 n=1 Tax=Mangifera indica TaxID=29780 RepID=UPI001CFAAD17|nr:trichoplein keratin filament-binding protein-like isoform X2 [Mangifera indica]
MDEKEATGSCLVVSEEKCDRLYPIYFGVSFAFFALRLLSSSDKEDEKWSELQDKMLQGSAQLLGLLVWRVQKEGATGDKCEVVHKLETAEKKIAELRKLRSEDAKANQKVISIFATQEQMWLNERKRLQLHIGVLVNKVRVLEKKKNEAVSELTEKLKETENLMASKDKILEEEEQKRKEVEEKLAKAESIAEKLREAAKQEAQDHSIEIWKHKTAFIELVSNQRQLEAELGRALRQVEAAKQELGSVLEQKEESVLLAQKLSMEILKMRKDLDKKDKVLSAMLRKSKLDTNEKQMLIKEVKLSKTKKKQAELETERWKTASESRDQRHSLRSMFKNQVNSRFDASFGIRGTSHTGKTIQEPTDYVLDLDHPRPQLKNDLDVFLPLSNYNSAEGSEEDVRRLEGWVRLEAEKYATVIEKRHHLELEAFAEQLRLKDEKLEAFRWQLLSMEIELKRLQTHIEGLNQETSQLRHNNMKLEAMLLERKEELSSLQEQFLSKLKSFSFQKTNINSFLDDPALTHDAIGSKVKISKRIPAEKEQETKTTSVERPQEKDTEVREENPSHNEPNKVIVPSPEREFQEDKDAAVHSLIQRETARLLVVDTAENLASFNKPFSMTNNSPWRMDLHALGVSYKIKRLKQQLLMFERLTGKSGEDMESNENGRKGLLLLMSLLNKQVSRYQSLQA